jgi:hypothetical protein
MKRLSHGVGANVIGEEVGSSVLIITTGAGLGFSVALHTSINLQTGLVVSIVGSLVGEGDTGDKVGSLVGSGVVIDSTGEGVGFSVGSGVTGAGVGSSVGSTVTVGSGVTGAGVGSSVGSTVTMMGTGYHPKKISNVRRVVDV